jgi:hypothetical protein
VEEKGSKDDGRRPTSVRCDGGAAVPSTHDSRAQRGNPEGLASARSDSAPKGAPGRLRRRRSDRGQGGGTVTWRFDGPTLHNITLANGPRGFSSKNLSDGRIYRKKLTVPGTYQLFCGLHPVDMTATIKVKGRRR